jgi:glycosyltransferase involved in cell wall biosynthesis
MTVMMGAGGIMLSVLHVLSSLNLGGAETFTIELAKLQRNEQISVHILGLNSADDVLIPAVKQQRLPFTISAQSQSRWQRYRDIHKLFQQFDVIHIHSPKAIVYLAPLLLLNSHKRIVYTRHGIAPLKSWYWRPLHFLLQPFVSRVTFVTNAGKEVFDRRFGWPEYKTKVIENGVCIPETCQINTQLPIRFGSVGRMIELKGQANLLKAVELLLKQEAIGMEGNFSLHFFGNGPLEAELKERAAAIDSNNIVFHGMEPDINRIYQDIDVLVVASQAEGLSMVIIEAMARGRPVIATRVGGNPSLVLPDATGTLVEFADIEAMADALRFLLRNPREIQRLGSGAREFISRNYSLNRTHQGFLECYTAAR